MMRTARFRANDSFRRSCPTPPRLAAGGFVGLAVSACLLAGSVFAQEDARAVDSRSRALAQDQKSVRSLITDLRARMSTLAERAKLGEASGAADANRLASASELLRKEGVEDLLLEAETLLQNRDLLPAVLQQEDALEKLNRVIEFLEARAVDDRDLDRKLEAVRQTRERAAQLARQQSKLLEKTREQLGDSSAKQLLEQLKAGLERLFRRQQELSSGKSSSEIDPDGQQNSLQSLNRARDAAAKLAEAQKRWNEQLRELPPEPKELGEARTLLGKLDAAIEKAETLRERALGETARERTGQPSSRDSKPRAGEGNTSSTPRTDDDAASREEAANEGRKTDASSTSSTENSGAADSSSEANDPSERATTDSASANDESASDAKSSAESNEDAANDARKDAADGGGERSNASEQDESGESGGIGKPEANPREAARADATSSESGQESEAAASTDDERVDDADEASADETSSSTQAASGKSATGAFEKRDAEAGKPEAGNSDDASRDGDSSGRSEAAQSSRSPSGENRANSSPRGESRTGKPSAERRAPASVEDAAREFAEALEDVDAEAKAQAEVLTPEAKRHLNTAKSAGRSSERAAASGNRPQVADDANRAREALESARREVAQRVAQLEERSALESAGLTQEEGILSQEAQRAATTAQQSANEAGSRSARSALEEASSSLSKAAQQMEEAAEALARGDRSQAAEAGARAQEELERNAQNLAGASEREAGRSAAERDQEFQQQLAEDAEELRRKTKEGLERKLRRKEDPGRLADAESSLGAAKDAMESAADAQRRGDEGLAKKKQEEAVEHLDRAREAVEDAERDELQRLERRRPRDDADAQQALAREARQAASAARSNPSGGESSPSGEQSEQLDQAAERMEEASEHLDEDDAESAVEDQEKALENLEEVAEELQREEERLERLRREQEMVNLIDSLRELKTGEEEILAETVRVEEKQKKAGRRRSARREIRSLLADLVTKQTELATSANSLRERLKRENAHVFSFVLESVEADMKLVATNLEERDAGQYTQFLEREIVREVERLIAALERELERAREQQEQQPQNNSQQQQQSSASQESLVSMVGELLMLQDLQSEVNRKTRDLEDLREASDDGPTDAWQRALQRLAQKQGSVSLMLDAVEREFEEAAGEEEADSDGAAGDGDDAGEPSENGEADALEPVGGFRKPPERGAGRGRTRNSFSRVNTIR